ncbi:hypothetical protein MFMK1_001794 [Metallumcola ferriviriculae]|uniref:Uncharacterized protein n=1 Tax=Metallumcola ferriviriculae TaxID=3039180 RepID=A0AAU0URX0_9FIRM|nr:hypothetical protein MFMK1_001794 [Desulfitibacteraceae bacterium MK1]
MGAMAVSFSRYKNVFLLFTAAMLALSYYLVYHKSNGSRLNKVIFWFSATLVAAMLIYTNRFLLMPWLLL